MIGVGMGNPLPHTMEIWRQTSTIVNAEETPGGLTQIHSALRCKLEAFAAWRQATILGEVGGYKYRVSWETAGLQEGDQCKYGGRWFELKLDSDDTLRDPMTSCIGAYYTGFLEELAVAR